MDDIRKVPVSPGVGGAKTTVFASAETQAIYTPSIAERSRQAPPAAGTTAGDRIAMREETKRRLERQLMWQRMKWAAAGLGVVGLMAGGFWATGLDASIETHREPGVVAAVGPLFAKSTKAIEEGLAVDVKLDKGPVVHVTTLKTTDPHIGDHVEVAEHVHGTGRITYSWK